MAKHYNNIGDVWDDAAAVSEPTPARLAELEASEARIREMEARKAGVTLTRFTLTIRDIDLESFTYDAGFDPPLNPESGEPMSAAERLGGIVLTHLAELLAKAAGGGRGAGEGEGAACTSG